MLHTSSFPPSHYLPFLSNSNFLPLSLSLPPILQTNLYKHVIEDVIRNMKEEYLNESMDTELLEELKQVSGYGWWVCFQPMNNGHWRRRLHANSKGNRLFTAE